MPKTLVRSNAVIFSERDLDELEEEQKLEELKELNQIVGDLLSEPESESESESGSESEEEEEEEEEEVKKIDPRSAFYIDPTLSRERQNELLESMWSTEHNGLSNYLSPERKREGDPDSDFDIDSDSDS